MDAKTLQMLRAVWNEYLAKRMTVRKCTIGGKSRNVYREA